MVRQQLRARGIRDQRILAAFQLIPRELFVPPEARPFAYADQALAIAEGQTISQPYIVAVMTEALAPTPTARVLDVGAGTGYQTAILAALAREVFAIERLAPLLQEARDRLDALGFTNVHWRHGDGAHGWPEAAPFDGVVVAAAAPHVPPALIGQLADRGRLVIPVGSGDTQDLVVVERQGDRFAERSLGSVRFVPLVSPNEFPQGHA